METLVRMLAGIGALLGMGILSHASTAAPRLSQPNGLAIAADGSLLIADGSGRVFRASTQTGRLRVVASGLGLAVDVAVAGKTLYVSAPHRVFRITNGRGVVLAGSATEGYAGDNGPAGAARLNWPVGLTINDGAVVIADMENSRIRRVKNGTIETIAGPEGLNRPHDVAVTPDGTILIADTDNNKVRRLGSSLQDMATVHNPFAIAVARNGSVYVADPLDRVVRQITPSGTIKVVTRRASNPGGVAVDNRGIVYVSDHDRAQILKIMPSGKTTVLVH